MKKAGAQLQFMDEIRIEIPNVCKVGEFDSGGVYTRAKGHDVVLPDDG